MRGLGVILLLLSTFIGFVVGGLFGYSNWKADGSYIPPRPANVPVDATWAGGADGGMWIDCDEGDTERYQCVVYATVTGVVAESGEFGLVDLQPVRYSSGRIAVEGRLVRSKVE